MAAPAIPPNAPAGPFYYRGLVATRSFAPNGLAATSRSGNFVSYHVATDDIDVISLTDGNWYATSASPYENASGATPTYTRYIRYPIASNWQHFLYSGAGSYTFSGSEDAPTDDLGLITRIPRGSTFQLGVHWESANGVPVYNFANQNFQTAANNNVAVGQQIWDASGTLAGRADIFATNSAIPSTSGSVQNAIMPTAIVGRTRRPAVGIYSNSRGYGTQDYPASGFLDGSGDLGHLARALGRAGIAYYNGSISGDTLANWNTTHAFRVRAAQYCSHILGFDLINDVNGAASAATLAARLATFLATSEFAGKKKFLVTTYPNPDATNTTPNSNDPARNAVNGMIRSGQIVGVDGFFDIDAVVSQTLNSGLFATAGGQPIQIDQLHLNYNGNVAVLNSGAVATGRIVRQ